MVLGSQEPLLSSVLSVKPQSVSPVKLSAKNQGSHRVKLKVLFSTTRLLQENFWDLNGSAPPPAEIVVGGSDQRRLVLLPMSKEYYLCTTCKLYIFL